MDNQVDLKDVYNSKSQVKTVLTVEVTDNNKQSDIVSLLLTKLGIRLTLDNQADAQYYYKLNFRFKNF